MFGDSPLLTEAYGKSLYKCPILKCPRFHRGFASRNLRDEHLRSHKRAYKCTVEGCDYLEIGFPTSADLTRHKQLCHCELTEGFTFPSVKRASLSQTLKDAIDRDDASAVRDLCAEMLAYPINETGFLFRAVKRKSFGAAFVLLELLGSDEFNHKARDGRTVLHELVKTNHVDFLKKILSTGIDVNAEDTQRRTPLSIALEHGHFDAARLLWSASDGKPKAHENDWNKAGWMKGFVRASSGGHDDIVPWIFSTIVGHFTHSFPHMSLTISHALRGAASNNHETTIKLILDVGRALDVEKHYSPRLKEATRKGIETIKLLEQPEIDGKGKTKWNALAVAALKDDSETVLRLLRNGADINYSSGLSRNALQAAAEHGSLSMVNLLLGNGADVNAICTSNSTRSPSTALQAASIRGHNQVVQMLLNKGADVNTQNSFCVDALQAAAMRGHGQVVQILLDNGADSNAHGKHYGSALQAASSQGHDQVVQMLLDRDVNINAQGGQYGNALHAASIGGHDQVVKMLLNKGANINAQNEQYGSALQAAAMRGHGQVVQILLDNGADSNAHGEHYGSALRAASRQGHDQVVQMLLDRGANINAQGGQYGNALQAASVGGHDQVVQRLLDRGANINAQGGEYGNALQAASRYDENEVMKILLNKGANINAQGGLYGNALQAASVRGRKQVVKILLDKGANVHARGGKHGSARQAALFHGHDEVVEMLVDRGAVIADDIKGRSGSSDAGQ